MNDFRLLLIRDFFKHFDDFMLVFPVQMINDSDINELPSLEKLASKDFLRSNFSNSFVSVTTCFNLDNKDDSIIDTIIGGTYFDQNDNINETKEVFSKIVLEMYFYLNEHLKKCQNGIVISYNKNETGYMDEGLFRMLLSLNCIVKLKEFKDNEDPIFVFEYDNIPLGKIKIFNDFKTYISFEISLERMLALIMNSHNLYDVSILNDPLFDNLDLDKELMNALVSLIVLNKFQNNDELKEEYYLFVKEKMINGEISLYTLIKALRSISLLLRTNQDDVDIITHEIFEYTRKSR